MVQKYVSKGLKVLKNQPDVIAKCSLELMEYKKLLTEKLQSIEQKVIERGYPTECEQKNGAYLQGVIYRTQGLISDLNNVYFEMDNFICDLSDWEEL